jgi:hypothetical protein
VAHAPGAPAAAPPYLVFEQAVADGAVEVQEIGAGTVPSVAATTKDQPVVIFAGDTITDGSTLRPSNPKPVRNDSEHSRLGTTAKSGATRCPEVSESRVHGGDD